MLQRIKSAAKKMLIDFEDTRKINHNPTKGRTREAIIIEQFLKPYLPKRFSIGSGLIIDFSEKESKQQDLIIFDENHSPVLLNVDSDKIIFAESTFAVLEVKSKLTTTELKDILTKAADITELKKTNESQAFLGPGLGIKTNHAPILFSAICFESDIKLDDLVKKIREYQKDIKNSYWLSMLLVLNDKNDDSGLIMNVMESNIQSIQLIPSPSSRLMKISAEDEGDALLYFYLHLMNHLRLCGIITPGPNLYQYAEAANLAKVDLSISRDEFLGASINVEGQKVQLSDTDRLRELVIKIFNDENTATDDEIIEFAALWPKMPHTSFIMHEDTRFRLLEEGDKREGNEGTILDFATPRELILAAQRKINGEPVESDKEILGEFIRLTHTLKPKKRTIVMEPPNNNQNFTYTLKK